MGIITESNAKIHVSEGKLSKKLPVFYNPAMKFNRDVSILLLRALGKKNLHVADPLAGSGVRAVRFLQELSDVIVSIAVNDYSSVSAIKKNFKLNKLSVKNVTFHSDDATLFLLNSTGFDYIDIDPFGTPNPFLDAAVKRIARDGILAVTATDTAALAGTAPAACRRKYWAVPLRNELMHEVGLRILIRKIQLVGAQFDKALLPVCSYSKEHYYRVFFRAEKSKEACDTILKQHHLVHYCSRCSVTIKPCSHTSVDVGPLWCGSLHDKKLLKKMAALPDDSFVHILAEESEENVLGFFDLHEVAARTKTEPLKTEHALSLLREHGYSALRTQFSHHAVKTNASLAQFEKLIQ